MESSFNQIENIINITINNLVDFINSNEDYINKLAEQTKYNIESDIGFNIFTSISDTYYKENLHSDILSIIFDPHTDKIGNIKYIEIFKNFIEEKINKRIRIDLNNIKIERETGKIDILIYDTFKNCIFIENKINNAHDMDDQIGRYYDKLLQNQYSVNAIVYLTLSPLKRLNWEYSIKDQYKRKEIKKILVEIPAVNRKNESSFVDDVITKCINASNNDDNNKILSTVYLTEYRRLLKYLGGEFMAEELNTQAMYKIFADRDTLKSFRIFGNLWDQRCRIIGNTFVEYFQQELGFSVHSGGGVFKKVKDGINIGFHTDSSFGFVYTPEGEELSSSNKKRFKELLENESIKKYFKNGDINENEWWVWGFVDYEKISCLDDLKKLEEELEKIIKEEL